MDIRQAIPADALCLSSLSMDVQRLHAEQHPNVFQMPQSENYAISFFEEMLVDPTVRIFVAEEGGDALGYILCRLIERPENPFTFAVRFLLIDQISVRPVAHGQGIGTALMQGAELLAEEWRVQRIQLDSWDFNIAAHGFFEHLGFHKFHFRFWRQLEGK